MENEKTLEVKFKDLQEALYEIQSELNDLMMALNEITDRYDTYWELSMKEAIKFYKGDSGNKVGEASYRFIAEYKKILWLTRVAKTYAEQIEEICEAVQV